MRNWHRVLLATQKLYLHTEGHGKSRNVCFPAISKIERIIQKTWQYVTKNACKPTHWFAGVLTFPLLPKRKKYARNTTTKGEKDASDTQDWLFHNPRLTISRCKTVYFMSQDWLFETTKGTIHDPQLLLSLRQKTPFDFLFFITRCQSAVYTALKFRAQRRANQRRVTCSACIPRFNNG